MKPHIVIGILIILVITTTAIVLAFAVQPIDNLREGGELHPFEIEVSASEDGKFALSCINGCAWTELGFNYRGAALVSFSGVGPQIISDRVLSDTDSRFLFQINKDGNTINMKGLKGQAWETLSYSSTPADTISFRINEMGMVSELD